MQAAFALHQTGVIQAGVDAVPHHPHGTGGPLGLGQLCAKQRGLGGGNKQAEVCPRGQRRLNPAQNPGLARIHPAQQRPAFLRIGGEFGRIDINEIDDQPAGEIGGHILAHLP